MCGADQVVLGYVGGSIAIEKRHEEGIVVGLRFVGKDDVASYLEAKTRFEGSSSKHRYPVK